jgi:putative ABC transport system permease protein
MLRDLLSDLAYRLRAMTARKDAERDLDDELRAHLDHETERLIHDGVAPDEARRRARLAFGNLEQVKESSRDAWGVRVVEHLGRDLSQGFRLAVKQPVFALIVMLSLALGIGATTAVFSLAQNILFVPIAGSHPEQLVALARSDKDGSDESFTWAEYRALRETPGVGSFASMRGASAVSVAAGERKESINLEFLEGEFFNVVGVRAFRGRLITEDDDARRSPVVVLAPWFAAKLFPGDTAVVGKTVLIRGSPFTVIGVTPRSFVGVDFPGSFTAAIPIGAVSLLGSAGTGRDNRGESYGAGDEREGNRRAFQVVGRLAMQPAVARASLALAFQRCCKATPTERLDVADIRFGIAGGKNDIRPQARAILAILLAGMVLVLVVVCCNIASLLLVRASARQREIAVRLALGASRKRLVSQLILENAPHAVLGGIGGLLVGAWYTSLFIRNLPQGWTDGADVGQLFGFHTGPALLAFAAGLTAACVIAFSVYPALRATRQQLAQTLRLDARASRTRRQGTVARGVVVAQVAVTVVLVTAASLFATSLVNLTRVDGGFATEHVLLASIETRSTPFEQTGMLGVTEEILRRVRSVPGVRSATMATQVPLHGGSNWEVGMRPSGYIGASDKLPSLRLVATVPGYFDVLGIGLASGRDFTDADGARSEPVAIVTPAFARRYLPDRDPLGQSLQLSLTDTGLTSVRIVGVARDAKYMDLRQVPEPMAYLPLVQTTERWHGTQVIVRTTQEPASTAHGVMRAIDAAAPGILVRRVADMQSVRSESMLIERLAARLATFVSVMALVLSVVGLYGVVAYSISRRTSEIGIRLALGARPRAVLWLVAKESLALVGVGVLVGVPLSFAAKGALGSQLFGVGARDPVAIAVSVLLLATAGVVAGVIPARRAARIDPRIALNAD